jgi:hypothetical protein
MKVVVWSFMKPILVVIGALWTGFMAFDAYDTSKIIAHTGPLKREIDQFRENNKQSFERLERESLMIRANQEKTHELLLKVYRK